MFKLLKGIEDMLSLCECRVNIGISEHADEKTRHGVLWVIADVPGNGVKNLRVPILIDKPNLVSSGLNYATWRRVKRQIEKMGITATHIELTLGNEGHFCYKLDEYKEIYASTTGRKAPMYTVGFA